MKCIAIATTCLSLTLTTPVSATSIESNALADIIVTSGWPLLEGYIPEAVANMERLSISDGATTKAAKILATEFQAVLTKGSMAGIFAQALENTLSVKEIEELHAFMRSKTGQKYLQLSNELANLKYFAPPLEQACAATAPQLNSFERESINSVCGQR